MSSLNMIKTAYAYEDSSDDDFLGFDQETEKDEQYSRCEKETLRNFQSFNTSTVSTNAMEASGNKRVTTEPSEQLSSSTILDPDSEGSFFETDKTDGKPREASRKRTKKEIRKLDIARRRRLAHTVIMEVCGCRKECDKLVSKDDRIEMNKSFWELDAAGQKCFIRERVHRKNVEKRNRYRITGEQLRKRHSYVFTIRTVASNESTAVCRKIFLNTLGYGDHCG